MADDQSAQLRVVAIHVTRPRREYRIGPDGRPTRDFMSAKRFPLAEAQQYAAEINSRAKIGIRATVEKF